MKKTGVILLGFLPDPRFEKRIALEKNLCDLHVVCWDRCKNMMPPITEDGFTIHNKRIKAENDPLKRLIPYYRFALWARKILKEINPDYIHVQGLDMLKIACTIKKWSKKKVSIIYDVADLHRLLIDKQNNPIKKIIQKYMRREEQRCCRKMDLLIITSKQYYNTYFCDFVPESKMMYFPNLPDLSAFKNYKKKDHTKDFTVGFIGGIRYKKQMENLVIAAKQSDVNLLIAGFEVQPPEIEPMCREYEKGEWVGRFDFEQQIAELYGKCDVMYSVYDADMANVRMALPNKLYEAMYCEIPIIVAKNTYLSNLVEEWKVGIGVDYKKPTETIHTLNLLKKNHDYYQKLCRNCRIHREKIDLVIYNNELEHQIRKMIL